MKTFTKKLIRTALVIVAPLVAQNSFAGEPAFDCHGPGSYFGANAFAAMIFGGPTLVSNIGTSGSIEIYCDAEPRWGSSAPASPQPTTVVLDSIVLENADYSLCALVISNGVNWVRSGYIPFAADGSLDASKAPNGVSRTVPSGWLSKPNLHYKTYLWCNLAPGAILWSYTTKYQ